MALLLLLLLASREAFLASRVALRAAPEAPELTQRADKAKEALEKGDLAKTIEALGLPLWSVVVVEAMI